MIDWDAVVGAPAVAIFGVPVQFEPVSGAAPFVAAGVFDEANLAVQSADGLGPANMTVLRPILGVQLAAFPAPPVQDDMLTVLCTGGRYWINEVRPDGHGGAMLLLNVAPPGRPVASS